MKICKVAGATLGVCAIASAARAENLFTPPLTLESIPSAAVQDGALELKPTNPPPTNTYGLTGDWFGGREKLRESNIYIGGFAIVDVSHTLRGGLDTEAYPVRYLLDIHAVVDADRFGLTGGTAYIDFQSHDQHENRDVTVGDTQGFDNIDAPRYVQFAQLWYKQAFGDVRVKIGKIDANTDAAPDGKPSNDVFSLIEHGLEFIHSAGAFSPAIWDMATYPDPPPGIQVFYGREDGFYIGAGALYSNRHQSFLTLSGHPESIELASGGMFLIGEAGSHWSWEDRPGHAGVGGWYHTGKFPHTDDPATHSQGAGGGYGFLDQSFFHQDAGVQRDLGGFISLGITDKRTSPIDQAVTAGLRATGFIPGRPDDSLGLMVSWAHLPAQPGLLHPFELATEGYYKIHLTDWASLKPAIQYINHPSGVHSDALVVTLRAEVDF